MFGGWTVRRLRNLIQVCILIFTVNGSIPKWIPVRSGVPSGCVQKRILFSSYINRIHSGIECTHSPNPLFKTLKTLLDGIPSLWCYQLYYSAYCHLQTRCGCPNVRWNLKVRNLLCCRNRANCWKPGCS